MSIDLRQEQRERQRSQPHSSPPRPRVVWVVAMAMAVIVALGAGITGLMLQEQPAPTGAVVVSYPEGALTAEREGGVYVVVPEPVAGFTDTTVGVREGGSYEQVAGFTDTAVGVREGGSYEPVP